MGNAGSRSRWRQLPNGLLHDGVEEGTELVMNPGAYKEFMDLPEVKLDTKIDIPEGELNGRGENFQRPQTVPPLEAPMARRSGWWRSRWWRSRWTRWWWRWSAGWPAARSSGMIDGMMGRYDTNGDGSIGADEMAVAFGSSQTRWSKPLTVTAMVRLPNRS